MEENPYQPPTSREPAELVRQRSGMRIHSYPFTFGVIFILSHFMMPVIHPPGRTYVFLVLGLLLVAAGGLSLLVRRP